MLALGGASDTLVSTCTRHVVVVDSKSQLHNRAASVSTNRLRGDEFLDRPELPSSLTEEERTLLELLGEGPTNQQIGKRMQLTESSDMSSASRLLVELGAERRTPPMVFHAGTER